MAGPLPAKQRITHNHARIATVLALFGSRCSQPIVKSGQLFIASGTQPHLKGARFLRTPLATCKPHSSCRTSTAPSKRGAAYSKSGTLRHAVTGVEGVAFWISAFSATHIGLSAIRDGIITLFGNLADRFGLVGTGLELPPFWPGDLSGNNIWADEAQAGRQLFRIFYSLVAAATLWGAFVAFVSAAAGSPALIDPLPQYARAECIAVASVAQGIAIASLTNPSPLSLVPGFRSDVSGGLVRDDSLKLRAFGLTRITRHPLILPVIPWAIANGLLAGGRLADLILFGGLALYALAGCWAQDLRAQESAAVGTVFARGDLTGFYETTSFLPFQALLDGRQMWNKCVEEIPWLPLVVGIAVGTVLEFATLDALA